VSIAGGWGFHKYRQLASKYDTTVGELKALQGRIGKKPYIFYYEQKNEIESLGGERTENNLFFTVGQQAAAAVVSTPDILGGQVDAVYYYTPPPQEAKELEDDDDDMSLASMAKGSFEIYV